MQDRHHIFLFLIVLSQSQHLLLLPLVLVIDALWAVAMLLVAAAKAPLGAAEVGRVRVAFRRIRCAWDEEVVAASTVDTNAAFEVLRG